MDRNDARAAALLVTVALLGVVVRWVMGGHGAPGEVGYHAGGVDRPSIDSVAQRAQALIQPLKPGELVDVNTADAAELMRLPRIGQGLAARIVRDRQANGPYPSIEAVTRVPGIGPSVRDAIRGHVSLPDGVAARPSDRRPLDLNTATAAQLDALPGIGPARARAILDLRKRKRGFRTVEELLEVPGIGPATLERLRALVRIS